jgi:propionyl-CoA synthetase
VQAGSIWPESSKQSGGKVGLQAHVQRSLQDRDGFWAEQAQLIDWHTAPQTILDYSRPPFARWYPDGTTNLCHNAIDRHLPSLAGSAALIYVSTETGQERTYTFAELHQEVMTMAAILQACNKAIGY